jgi:uncharacterized membrane protein
MVQFARRCNQKRQSFRQPTISSFAYAVSRPTASEIGFFEAQSRGIAKLPDVDRNRSRALRCRTMTGRRPCR